MTGGILLGLLVRRLGSEVWCLHFGDFRGIRAWGLEVLVNDLPGYTEHLF